MGHDGHHGVVALRRDGHDLGAEGRDDGPDLGVGVAVGALDRREHPGATLEEISPRSVDPLQLTSGHGVPAHVARIGHEVEHGGLHAAGVGDEPGRLDQGLRDRVVDHPDGSGDECDGHVDGPVGRDSIDGAELEGPLQVDRVPVASEDRPPATTQRQADRAPDETGPDDESPTGGVPSLGRARSGRQVGRGHVTRAGRRADPPHLPGRRGATPNGHDSS